MKRSITNSCIPLPYTFKLVLFHYPLQYLITFLRNAIMAVTFNGNPSTQGHTLSPPNGQGVEKPVQTSFGETKTDNSTESAIFHLEAAWGTETIDVSLKVGAVGIALTIALALMALVSLTAWSLTPPACPA